MKHEPRDECRSPLECLALGCPNRTREGKPYCPEHVGLNPHASQVLKGIVERHAEQATASASGKLAADLVLRLKEQGGVASTSRLAQVTSFDVATVEALLKVLKEAGKVRLGKTQRGKTIATLSRKGRRG